MEEEEKKNGIDNQTPPPVPEKDKMDLEKEWADRLGMSFDPEVAEKAAGDPRPDELPPVYLMPEGTQLPPKMPQEPMPPTYLVWSIIATICCCLPAGVAAIIFSSQVSSRYYARDFKGARRASRQAEIWIIVSIVTGIIVNALYMPLSLLIQS